MFEALARGWVPIFNIWSSRGDGASSDAPSWDTFKTNFHQGLPLQQSFVLPRISGLVMWRWIQSKPSSRAGGLDGWRVFEAKMLPPFFVDKMADVSECVEEGAQWPQSFLDVPQPWLRK